MLFVVPVQLIVPIAGDRYGHGVEVDADNWAEAMADVLIAMGPDWEVSEPFRC
ncbi:hypothetical protein [Microbacterium sp. CIAB417]|uniref:hypothetical protein n=1 Tax=Microbacterium sp. CIAB417 TaxID=2860287 RepID=UPI001FAC5E2C|nr:hypothetical protein [Microbacterium sp. CIAB417]